LKTLPEPFGDDPFTREFTCAILELIEFCENSPEFTLTYSECDRGNERIWWQRNKAAKSQDHPDGGLSGETSQNG